MPKKKRQRKPAHRTAKRPTRRSREPDLLDSVRSALASGEPLSLLLLASSLLAAVDPRQSGPLSLHDEPDSPTRDELVESMLAVPLPETSALLLALGALIPDELLQRRIRREVDTRGHDLLPWLENLDEATPGEVLHATHVFGDGDNVMIGVDLPGSQPCSVVVHIDHNAGSIVEDAFVGPLEVQRVAEALLADGEDPDPDVQVEPLPPADARVRVSEAIDLGAITIPRVETDTWPGCRALVEWVLRMLPEGGSGYVRPEWDDDARADLTERFFASSFGAPLAADEDSRSLLESLLWFGADYGPGDPLRWSPTSVTILLLDWIPRKIVADADYLSKVPALLRAFVQFCHDECGLQPGLTAETLEAVDELAPEYQEIIRSPRLQGPEALIAQLQAHDDGRL